MSSKTINVKNEREGKWLLRDSLTFGKRDFLVFLPCFLFVKGRGYSNAFYEEQLQKDGRK